MSEIISIYDSAIDISDNGLFQLSREANCLLATSVWQGTKTCMLPTAISFPEDMSHRSLLALEIQGFSRKFLPPRSQSVSSN